MRALAATGVLVALVGPASANGADDPQPDEKSVTTAMTWSLGVTTLGVAALAGTAVLHSSTTGAKYPLFAVGSLGLLAGPSLGRMYAGHWLSGGEVVRLVGFGVMTMGEAFANACLGEPNAHGCSPKSPQLSAGPIIAGGAVMALGALFDLAEIPSDVEERNRGAKLTLHPIPIATPNGTAPGISFAGQF